MAHPDLKADVQQQMIAAMKSGDKPRTQVLRMILSEIKRVEVDKPDADPQAAVTAYGKILRKSAGEMEKLHQPDRVAQLQSEIAIVDEFLPKQMDDAALDTLVNQTLASLGAVTRKDLGRATGAVMKAAAATGAAADPGKVRSLLESKMPQ